MPRPGFLYKRFRRKLLWALTPVVGFVTFNILAISFYFVAAHLL